MLKGRTILAENFQWFENIEILYVYKLNIQQYFKIQLYVLYVIF